MLNVIILILILLENSLAIDFPYNVIALPYLTFLAYKKGKNGILEVMLICIIISNSESVFLEIGIIFMLIYLISYFMAKVLGYDEINSVYYTIIQAGIYGTYLYVKLPHFSLGNLVVLTISYLFVNYIYIKKLRKKL